MLETLERANIKNLMLNTEQTSPLEKYFKSENLFSESARLKAKKEIRDNIRKEQRTLGSWDMQIARPILQLRALFHDSIDHEDLKREEVVFSSLYEKEGKGFDPITLFNFHELYSDIYGTPITDTYTPELVQEIIERQIQRGIDDNMIHQRTLRAIAHARKSYPEALVGIDFTDCKRISLADWRAVDMPQGTIIHRGAEIALAFPDLLDSVRMSVEELDRLQRLIANFTKTSTNLIRDLNDAYAMKVVTAGKIFYDESGVHLLTPGEKKPSKGLQLPEERSF